MRIHWPQLAGLLLVVAAGAAVLLRFPPAATLGYPYCPFFAATGLLCPGCGGTRALAALLHGRLGQAWLDNALLVGLVPVVVAYFGVAGWRAAQGYEAEWPSVRTRQIALMVIAAVGFAVWRNLG